MAHILLADDDDAMRTFLQHALEQAGHSVHVCADGIEALEAIKNASAPYDLLLTDIVMPGMDGIELAKVAQTHIPTLKTLYITGFSAIAAKQNSQNTPESTVISKPFHLKDIIDQVEQLLGKP